MPRKPHAYGPPEWPRTVREAAQRLAELLTPDDCAGIACASREEMNAHDFRIGAYIRNDFALWRGNDELRADCGWPEQGPAECAAAIIDELWSYLRREAA